MYKKIIKLFIFISLLFTILNYFTQNVFINAEENDIIQSNLYAYGSKTNFSGSALSPQFSLNDYVKLNIEGNGGMHVIDGKEVYSNYVLISLDFLYDGSLILKDGSKITYCDNDKIDGKWLNKNKKYDLKTDIAYGAIMVSKKYKEGKYEVFNWIQVQSSSTSLQPLALTEDGDYYVRIFFETIKNGAKMKYVAEYVIPVRSSIFLRDKTGNYSVKDHGCYYDSVMLDFNNRKDIVVVVNGQIKKDKELLEQPGKYNINVYGGGYLSESIDFEIFPPDSVHLLVNANNITEKLDTGFYKAEGYFDIDWSSYGLSVNAKFDYSSFDKKIVKSNMELIRGQKFTEPGTYTITLESPYYNQIIYYGVILTPYNSPTHNFNMLSGNRFNNFITKWYEVYNETNGEYSCFHTSEYYKAYDFAMTLEKEKVTYYGDKYLYNNEFYYSSTSIAEALNEEAVKRIKLQYYDIDNSNIEKKFSNNLFDGTIYLNDDFIFTSKSDAETCSVTLIDKYNNYYSIDYNKMIGLYNFNSGVYTVIEVDIYGNENKYEVIIDKESPKILLQLNENIVELEDGMEYKADYFSIENLTDICDEYAVVSVNNEDFYLSNELESKIYFSKGTYYVKAYDRNGNRCECKIIIENDTTFYNIEESRNNITLTFNGSYALESVEINEVNYEINDNKIVISKDTFQVLYKLILVNENNKIIIDYEFNNDTMTNNNNSKILCYLYFILILISIFIALVGLIFLLIDKRKYNALKRGGIKK